MQSFEVVELAALVAVKGPLLIMGSEPLAPQGVEKYWIASKCRLDRWNRTLKLFSPASQPRSSRSRPRSHIVPELLEEVLAGEVLTRVWSAVLFACDRRHGTGQFDPLGHSVLLSHLEVRKRGLEVLMHAPGIQVERAIAVNRLRRKSERWIDLLIARLLGASDVSRFASSPSRAKEFARDLADEDEAAGPNQVWPLVQTALRNAFRPAFQAPSANPDLNQRIAASVSSSFPPEYSDSSAMLNSLWINRMLSAAGDAEELLATICDM